MKKPIINLAELTMKEASYGDKFQEYYCRIGPLIGAQKLGYTLYNLPPGKRGTPRHIHHKWEEVFFILEGDGLYHSGQESWPIKSGDIIAAPAGLAETAHQIVNNSQGNLKFLAISTKEYPELIDYPDSGKFMVLSELSGNKSFEYIGRESNSLAYWDGEEK